MANSTVAAALALLNDPTAFISVLCVRKLTDNDGNYLEEHEFTIADARRKLSRRGNKGLAIMGRHMTPSQAEGLYNLALMDGMMPKNELYITPFREPTAETPLDAKIRSMQGKLVPDNHVGGYLDTLQRNRDKRAAAKTAEKADDNAAAAALVLMPAAAAAAGPSPVGDKRQLVFDQRAHAAKQARTGPQPDGPPHGFQKRVPGWPTDWEHLITGQEVHAHSMAEGAHWQRGVVDTLKMKPQLALIKFQAGGSTAPPPLEWLPVVREHIRWVYPGGDPPAPSPPPPPPPPSPQPSRGWGPGLNSSDSSSSDDDEPVVAAAVAMAAAAQGPEAAAGVEELESGAASPEPLQVEAESDDEADDESEDESEDEIPLRRRPIAA